MTARASGRDVTSVSLVFLAVSFVASLLLAPLQLAVGVDADVFRLTVLSTAVGAAVVAAIWWGRLPFPDLDPRAGSLPRALLTAVALGTLFLAVLMAVNLVLGSSWSWLDPTSLAAPLALVLGLDAVGAAAEEVGWRGVVQPALETRCTPLTAALATGVLFGLGHVYVLGAGVAAYALFVVGAVGLSLALAVVTTGRRLPERVLTATFLHWAVNVGTLVLFADGDESIGWVAVNAVAGVVLGLVSAVLLVRRRGPRIGVVSR